MKWALPYVIYDFSYCRLELANLLGVYVEVTDFDDVIDSVEIMLERQQKCEYVWGVETRIAYR